MKGAEILLKMLEAYGVEHVFGLPGETTLPWYKEWHKHPQIEHVLTRDERSASFMAEAYAKVAFKPGVCEGPSPGAAHMLPGVAEAFKASVPMIVFTSDVPLNMELRNMLTGCDQTRLFEPVSKAAFIITSSSEIPFILRRAFRIATAGKPGPVHIRIPSNVFYEEADVKDLYAQDSFASYPGHRPVADPEEASKALELLLAAETPLIICGQGVLYSQAWDEVSSLAEGLEIPVGTTMTGKGSISELHPWSIGVVGARGGTSLSNRYVEEADLIFYIGSNTDSAGTDGWKLPNPASCKRFIQLDVSEAEVGNVYPVDVALIGDAKSTLRAVLEMLKGTKLTFSRRFTVQDIERMKLEREALVRDSGSCDDFPFHPLRILKEFKEAMPENGLIAVDAGVSSIYSTAFYAQKRAGRQFLSGYSMGALGYAVPAAFGAWVGGNGRVVAALTGDGSFAFTVGELETLVRFGANVKVFLYRNDAYGWIRGESVWAERMEPFAADFSSVDHAAVARAYGLAAFRPVTAVELSSAVREAFAHDGPALVELAVTTQDRLVPPVPKWVAEAKTAKAPYIY